MDTHTPPICYWLWIWGCRPRPPQACAMEHTQGPEEHFAARPIRCTLGHSGARSHEESHVTTGSHASTGRETQPLGITHAVRTKVNHIHTYSPTHLPSSCTAGHRHTWGF